MPTSSTVFRNSNKHKTARQTIGEWNSQCNRTSKSLPNVTVQTGTSHQNLSQRATNVKGNVISASPSAPTSQNVVDTLGGTVTTTELQSSLTLGNDLGIADPAAVSVILNGPLPSGDLLANHLGGSTKVYSQAPSPRGSHVIPPSPSPPASVVYNKSSQVKFFDEYFNSIIKGLITENRPNYKPPNENNGQQGLYQSVPFSTIR